MRHPLAKIAYADWSSLKERYGTSLTEREKCAEIERTSLENESARIEEQARFGAAIADTNIEHPPIFLIGHWRSGTTHLQNLLSQDDRFGYLNVVQSLNPHTFLTREAQYLAEFTKTKRMMDNVELTGSVPSEEEVALGIVAPGSFWHGYYVPEHFDYYFRKYTLFEGISAPELAAWRASYLHLLKKLTLRHGGKQLILKNPPNTGRISVLLDMFPNARFIHIHRDPFEVYHSRMAQFQSAVRFKALQPISRAQWEEKVLRYYVELLSKHLRERSLIPAENYAEVSFHALKREPLETMRTIYRKLRLPDFAHAEPAIRAHLSGLSDYAQNTYQVDVTSVDKVAERWSFALAQWGYARPEVRA